MKPPAYPPSPAPLRALEFPGCASSSAPHGIHWGDIKTADTRVLLQKPETSGFIGPGCSLDTRICFTFPWVVLKSSHI